MKKWISRVLVVAMLCSFAVPVGAVFTDINDSKVEQDVAILQMMGVVNGTSATTFNPNGYLTRGEFCKMAVTMMGVADAEALHRNRTIFPDVLSTHWARGYINLAVSIDLSSDESGTKLISGMSDGTFRPDQNITYAEAVTILMRMLGYQDADASMMWPQGYLDLAAQMGLTKGMNNAANSPLKRGDAATLFVSALCDATQKAGGPFYNKLGEARPNVVVTSANAVTEDGTKGALGTSEGVYKTVSGIIPQSLVGMRGTLVTDDRGLAVVFIPVGDYEVITIKQAEASWIVDGGGKRYSFDPNMPAHTPTGKVDYGSIWMDLRVGGQVVLFYSPTGKIDGIFVNTQKAQEALVARNSGIGSFSAILDGATNYKIYRDGVEAEAKDIVIYDVGTFDSGSNVLTISSNKITGHYDNVWPNMASASIVTVLGKEVPILPSAVQDVARFELGDEMTLLLTADGQVAGAIPPVEGGQNIGILTENQEDGLHVALFNGINVPVKDKDGHLIGQLVNVVSKGKGKIVMYRISRGDVVYGDFDVDKGTVGGVPLALSCRVYEQVQNSKMGQVNMAHLAGRIIEKSSIGYVHTNQGGQVDTIVLNDVTGDLYSYGMFGQGESRGGEYDTNSTVMVINADHKNGTLGLTSNMRVEEGQFVGIIGDADETNPKLLKKVDLTKRNNIKRNDFTVSDDKTTVIVDGATMLVSDHVQCYNSITESWFKDLASARAFSDNLTVYYDRGGKNGGKVRIVVAN